MARKIREKGQEGAARFSDFINPREEKAHIAYSVIRSMLPSHAQRPKYYEAGEPGGPHTSVVEKPVVIHEDGKIILMPVNYISLT